MENIQMMNFEGIYISCNIGEQVVELIYANKKLEAIQVFREGAGVDLKTAKDAVDSYCIRNEICNTDSKDETKIHNKTILFIIIVLLLLIYIFRDMIIDYIKNVLFIMASSRYEIPLV